MVIISLITFNRCFQDFYKKYHLYKGEMYSPYSEQCPSPPICSIQ